MYQEILKELNDLRKRVEELARLEREPALSGVLLRDGSATLTAEWDIGEDMSIKAERLEARDAEGLRIEDDGGNLGVFVEDGGNVGIGTNDPEVLFHVNGSTGGIRLIRTAGNAFIDMGESDSGSSGDGMRLRTLANLNALVIGSYAGLADYIYINATGIHIGGNVAPSATMHVLQATLGSVVQRLQSTATNDDPTEDRLHGRVATTNATVTTVLTIPITASNTYLIEVQTIARRTGGSAGAADDGGIGQILAGYKTLAGTVTLIATLSSTFQGTGTYAQALTISGTNVLVQVTGMVNHDVSWHVFVTMKKLGT